MAHITDEKTERFNRAARLATDIIEECRVQLMLKFRFLDLALWRMELVPVHAHARYPLSTDGKNIYFEPYSVLARFEESFDEAVRDYLHLVLHCIFRHPYNRDYLRNREAWSLACDVIVESVAMEMCATRFTSEQDEDREQYLSQLKQTVGAFMPAKLYHLFDRIMKNPEGTSYFNYSKSNIVEMQALFERDNHESWPAFNDQEGEEKPGDIEEIGEEDDNADEVADTSAQDLQSTSDMDMSQSDPSSDQKQEGQDDGDDEQASEDDDAEDVSSNVDGSGLDTSDDELEGSSSETDTEQQVNDENAHEEKEWEEISRQIEMNLETFSKEWGDEARDLISSLAIANRKTYDYSDFLRRFATVHEDMRINDDEFDYIFYTYGLELYGNMPLVEPLEYKETKSVRDFVIAIDTSESVSGDLCKRFIEHTFDILMNSEEFGTKVNIHIIQCDARVQSDTKITNPEQLKEYLANFYVRGFGGTDFRPVFDYVSDLQDRGELENLQGLLYFTDGLGYYPDKMPPYDVAFVFIDNGETHLPSVPPWAMRVVIDEDGINRFKSAERAHS